jgi:hypothetical protein
MLGAVAHMIELTKNQATDTRRMSFLPQMSDSFALGDVRGVHHGEGGFDMYQIGAEAALASKYAEPTHV